MRNQGRDNETWLSDLRSNGARQRAALSDLRAILLRSLNAALDKSASVNDSFLEDTVQDSLMLILERLDQFEGRSKFLTWATSIAVRSAPEKYAPAFGGYCAFGVSVGKKFVGDPEVWRLVDGKLCLNLDVNIQGEWLKDVPGRIKTANENWQNIKNTPAAAL